MVVLRRLPFLRHMALCTVGSAGAAMLIVRGVAAVASLGRLFVMARDMAGVAAHAQVRAGEIELGLVVVEFRVSPGRRTVTFAAGLRELVAMYIVLLVAADAGGRGLAPGLSRFMTALAWHTSMRALEGEVGQVMIELGLIQLNDVGVTPFVLGMACATFTYA